MIRDEIKKLTYVINSVILFMVFGLMVFFAVSGATFLVWFSIPTALVYVAGYFLIARDKLDVYVRLVFGWLIIYMNLATICLGTSFGFHLYCLSMLPIIFYTEYMAYQLKLKPMNTILYSSLAIASFLISVGYSAYAEPVYDIDSHIAGAFLLVNSVIVLGFVTFYSRILIKMIIASEKMLSDRANKDRLTKLFNRHYTMERLKEAYDDNDTYNIAMIDIDNFKMINDKYGHSAGDEVLRQVSAAMEEVCGDSLVSRWGGEEFLILTKDDPSLIEKVRAAVEQLNIKFEGETIKVTLTAGVEKKDKSMTLDKWIVAADEKLYFGKNNGKNRVVT